MGGTCVFQDGQDGGYSHTERQNQMEQKKNWRELIQDLKLFIWNPEKKEVLGRNGKSWGKKKIPTLNIQFTKCLLYYNTLGCIYPNFILLCVFAN